MAGKTKGTTPTKTHSTPVADAQAPTEREQLQHALSCLSDAEQVADYMTADLQAIARTAELLLNTRTGYAGTDASHRATALVLLGEVLPQHAAKLSARITALARAAGAPTLHDTQRHCLDLFAQAPTPEV